MTFLRPAALLALVLTCVSGFAHADESDEARKAADRLVIEGKKLGDAGRVTEAIERFKAAEARYPRAIHGCNIGLAYAQLKSYPQALLFLENCRTRATGPLPAWVEARYQRTIETLRAGGYGALEVITEPAGSEVQVMVFARDEVFLAPRTIWLSSGEVELQISREGYVTHKETVRIDRPQQRLVVKLQRVPVVEPQPRIIEKPVEVKPQPPVVVEPKPQPAPPPRGRLSLKIAGGTVFAAGALTCLVAWVPTYVDVRNSAVPSTDPKYAEFNRKRDHLESTVYPAVLVSGGIVTLAGLGMVVAGVVLPASNSKTGAVSAVSVSPTVGGGQVFVEGRF